MFYYRVLSEWKTEKGSLLMMTASSSILYSATGFFSLLCEVLEILDRGGVAYSIRRSFLTSSSGQIGR